MSGQNSIRNAKINHEVAGKEYEDFIHNIILKNGFHPIREFSYYNEKFNQKEKTRDTDFKIAYQKMVLNLEADGYVHEDLENPTKSTRRRNADLMKLGIPLIIINKDSIKTLIKFMRDEDKLNGCSEKDITEIITTYLLWMEYSKYISRE